MSVEQVGARAEREVHRFGVADAPHDGVGDHRGDGVDVREVPGLPAVAVDLERPAGESGVDERRHDGGVGVAGGLAWPEDVEQAQRQRRQTEAVGVGVRVRLGGQLARRVRATSAGSAGPRAWAASGVAP